MQNTIQNHKVWQTHATPPPATTAAAAAQAATTKTFLCIQIRRKFLLFHAKETREKNLQTSDKWMNANGNSFASHFDEASSSMLDDSLSLFAVNHYYNIFLLRSSPTDDIFSGNVLPQNLRNERFTSNVPKHESCCEWISLGCVYRKFYRCDYFSIRGRFASEWSRMSWEAQKFETKINYIRNDRQEFQRNQYFIWWNRTCGVAWEMKTNTSISTIDNVKTASRIRVSFFCISETNFQRTHFSTNDNVHVLVHFSEWCIDCLHTCDEYLFGCFSSEPVTALAQTDNSYNLSNLEKNKNKVAKWKKVRNFRRENKTENAMKTEKKRYHLPKLKLESLVGVLFYPKLCAHDVRHTNTHTHTETLNRLQQFSIHISHRSADKQRHQQRLLRIRSYFASEFGFSFEQIPIFSLRLSLLPKKFSINE